MSHCDHKFIDSKHCLKCGWEPPARVKPGAGNVSHTLCPQCNRPLVMRHTLTDSGLSCLVHGKPLPGSWHWNGKGARQQNDNGGCHVELSEQFLHVSAVYVDPNDPCGFSVPLDLLRALLSRAGLALVPAADVITPEERAVLEAMAGADIETVGGSNRQRRQFMFELQEDAACRAELARRAEKEVRGA